MELTAMQIMLLIDTLKGSLEIVNGYGRNFAFSDEDRQKVLEHLTYIMNSTCICLDGATGKSSKQGKN